MSIILNDGHFHIYQYRVRDRSQKMFSPVWINLSSTSWRKKMVGHFGNGKAMVPFTASEKLYLLVFMGENTVNHRLGDNDAIAVDESSGNEIAKVYTFYYY